MTHFDLCGWVLFPGSSNVHAEFDVRHDWHGCPSSHLIRRRLCPAPSTISARSRPTGRVCSPTTVARPAARQVPSASFRMFGGEEWRDETLTHLLSLNRRSLRRELVWDGLTSAPDADDDEAIPLPFCCKSVGGDSPRPKSLGLLGESAESMAGHTSQNVDRSAKTRAQSMPQTTAQTISRIPRPVE